MSFSMRPSGSRLREIRRRQDPPKFGASYDPAIRATREEAPQHSRPSRIYWPPLMRQLHVLSTVERDVLLLCLYVGRPWEVQEQRMLPMIPSPHPMARHRRAASLPLLPLQGTLEVAERLGYLKLHPWIRAANKDTGEVMTQPFPWIGDLLFFRSDEQGPYAVNVTVKQDPADFDSPYRGRLMGCRSDVRARERSVARHAIEHQLYADAGIRTVRATRKDVAPMVGQNLCRILGGGVRSTPLSGEQQLELCELLNRALVIGQPFNEVIFACCAKFRVSFEDVRGAAYQAIWAREVRVDLTQPLLFDASARPEDGKVIADLVRWIGRE